MILPRTPFVVCYIPERGAGIVAPLRRAEMSSDLHGGGEEAGFLLGAGGATVPESPCRAEETENG